MTFEEQWKLAVYQSSQNDSLELLRSVIAFSIEILKTAMLINGGGAVALLAFTGAVWSSGQNHLSVQSLSTAVLWFTGGVLATVVGTVLGYFTQRFYYARHTHDVNAWMTGKPGKQAPMTQGYWFHVFAALCVVVAIGCFCVGIYTSIHAFAGDSPSA